MSDTQGQSRFRLKSFSYRKNKQFFHYINNATNMTISADSSHDYLEPVLPSLSQNGQTLLRGFYGGAYTLPLVQTPDGATHKGQFRRRDPSPCYRSSRVGQDRR